MKKKYIGPLIVILVIMIGYSSVWIKSYNRAREFYIAAMENYNSGEITIALKGGKVRSNNSEYVYIGGFQQAYEMFESKYAIPKPKLMDKSEVMINRIIDEVTIEEGKEIFQSNFGIDNRYLPDILIRIGDLYYEQEQYDKSEETYQMVVDAFSRYEEQARIAQEKLKKFD